MRRVIYKELPQKRRFGVELEVSNNLTKQEIGTVLKQFEALYGVKRHVKVTNGEEGWAQTADNDYWHVKFDRTCGPKGKEYDYGWEVASYIASGSSDIDHISRAARFLHNFGAQTNRNCGLHVHVETTDYDTSMMGVLLARWLKVEAALFKICHICREISEYCQSIRSREKRKKAKFDPVIPGDFWFSMQPTNFNPHNNQDKRYSLNTIGFATSQIISNYTRNTVELRLPECTLEEGHVRNWTKLILQFVEASTDVACAPADTSAATDLSEIMYYLGLAGAESKFYSKRSPELDELYVLDQELLGLKVWILKKFSSCLSRSLASQAKKMLDFIGQI